MAMKTNYWFNRNRFLSGLRFIALLLACSAIAQSAIAVTPSFPLKKSANNRYLTTQVGTPFLLVGDSVWYLPVQGTDEDIDTYLTDRASKGFNTVLVQIIDNYYADNAPNNIDGVAPFTVPGNFSTANPAYFARFDYILTQANNRGMVVIAFPLFLGYQCGTDGWANQVLADTTAHIQSYATFLGNRYKNFGNIIWVMGGDTDPQCATGLAAKVDAFATALVAADPNHLVTEHNQGRNEAVTPWLPNVPSWLNLNSVYGPSPLTFTQGQTAYNRTPTRPFFLIESYYENDGHGLTRKQLRNQEYWALLSGCGGFLFGNCPIWGLSSTQTLTHCVGLRNADWHQNLDSPGALDIIPIKNLFTSVAWQMLVPDFAHTVVTSGYGSGTTTVTTARASDGSFVISYLPVVTGIAVDMTRLTGSSLTARWYDPTNGTYTNVAGSPFPNTGTRVFTPTGNNNSGASDWVLLLQSSTSPTPSGWNLITTGDFNRNGKPDYVLYNGSTRRTAIWYLNNSVYIGSAYGPTLPSGWQLVEKTRDFNGDGKPDYVLYKTSTRQTAIWYLNNNVFLGGAYSPTLPAGWMLTGTGDFNGDIKPDYVLYNSRTRQTAIWYLNNNVFLSGVYAPTLPPGWSLAGVGDFNRDGKRDYLLFNASTRQTAIWYLSGVTFIGGLYGPTLPSGWQLVETADFNGDGKPDYLLHNPSTRRTAIWYLNNNILLAGAYGPTVP
jgi:uncharacterized protein DUF4038/collagenase-like protein with putative collagen-binding domain/VCBS repeat protein